MQVFLEGRYKQWNGLLEWNTGLDYWNGYLVTFYTLTQCTYQTRCAQLLLTGKYVGMWYVCLLVGVSASQAIQVK